MANNIHILSFLWMVFLSFQPSTTTHAASRALLLCPAVLSWQLPRNYIWISSAPTYHLKIIDKHALSCIKASFSIRSNPKGTNVKWCECCQLLNFVSCIPSFEFCPSTFTVRRISKTILWLSWYKLSTNLSHYPFIILLILSLINNLFRL